MPERKVLITLVSLSQAREGFTFLHKGAAPKCQECQYFHVCVKNLETWRVYRVVGMREKTVPCRLAEKDMMVVEVVESEIEAAIPAKQAIEGAVIVFQKQDCGIGDCASLQFCSPGGLSNGDRCKIVKITGNLRCPQGLLVVGAVLRRVPAS